MVDNDVVVLEPQTEAEETVYEWQTLDASHRCDRCKSQAYIVVVSNKSGRELLLCCHHYYDKEDAYRAWGTVVLDEREKLNNKEEGVHA